MNTRAVGKYYEEKAAAYLQEKGYRILARNFRCHQGEIDIVAQEGRTIVFVEVKYRAGTRAGWPEEAVTRRKQYVISRVADYYCVRYRIQENIPCRFDCVALVGDAIHHYKNAFDYMAYRQR